MAGGVPTMDCFAMAVRFGLGDPKGSLATWFKSERGMALPAALMVLFMVASIAAALMPSAIAANSQSNRDRGVKRAVAAADGGLQAAVYRINKLKPDALGCVVQGLANQLVIEPLQPDGWCRAQTEDLGDGARYSYRVKAGVNVTLNGQNVLQHKIVSTGTVSGVTRRTQAIVGTAVGSGLFSGKGLISDKDLFMENNVVVTGHAASNGNIHIENNVQICGNATPGPGKQVTIENNADVCGLTDPATQKFVLNPVGPIPAADGNLRIGTLDAWSNKQFSFWDPLTKELQLQNNATLSLTGNVYHFCKLTIKNNSQLIIASRLPTEAPVAIYLDAPENCPGVEDAGSVTLQNNGSILNLNGDPTTLQLYVTGSPTIGTTVEFKNNFDPQVNMALYAPNSYVVLQNNTYIVGAIAAGQVFLQNNSRVVADGRTDGIGNDNTVPLFKLQRWSECTSKPTGSAPDAGC